VTTKTTKEHLRHYLHTGRDALLWKLDGLSEYDVRRPLVPTGTNLLGLVKHTGSVVAEYFGLCFDRPFPEPMPWLAEDAETNADMWATAEESRADIVGFYQRAWAHADATIDALPADATGAVPWWGGQTVTLEQIMVHVTAEMHRHAGHADLVRELIDGAAGLSARGSNLPGGDAAWWSAYRDRLESVARSAAER
jgi:Protein of unknown function (DUF664)